MTSLENKILLVEDDTDIRENLKTYLEMENFDIVTASNGQQAIDLILKTGRPSLILLDLMMPVMNGYEMLSAIKKQNIHQDNPIPIILLSAATDVEKSILPLVSKFVKKPIALDLLVKAIKELRS